MAFLQEFMFFGPEVAFDLKISLFWTLKTMQVLTRSDISNDGLLDHSMKLNLVPPPVELVDFCQAPLWTRWFTRSPCFGRYWTLAGK